MITIIRKISFALLDLLFNLFGKELTEELFERYFEFIKFVIVGVSNTLVSYFVYFGIWHLLNYIGPKMHFKYILAQIISFVIGVVWSFYWNNKFVFVDQGKRHLLRAFVKMFISYSLTGIILNSLFLVVWVKVFNISELIAPLINLIWSVPLNFLLNKYWSFK